MGVGWVFSWIGVYVVLGSVFGAWIVLFRVAWVCCRLGVFVSGLFRVSVLRLLNLRCGAVDFAGVWSRLLACLLGWWNCLGFGFSGLV